MMRRYGFAVLPNAVSPQNTAAIAEAYDRAVCRASAEDIFEGSTSTRVIDFVNRGPHFTPLFTYPPLLSACERIIAQPFRLSSLHARTVHAHAVEQRLHVDQVADGGGWPLVGFIYMIDAFGTDNGATRFVIGSHGDDAPADTRQIVSAYGPAGALLIFNGSIWHGHGANFTNSPRRSIQGAFIRRSNLPATDFASRMSKATHLRLSPAAKYVLGFSDAPSAERSSHEEA